MQRLIHTSTIFLLASFVTLRRQFITGCDEKFCLILIYLIGSLTSQASASVLDTSFDYYIRNATKVVRGKITKQTPIIVSENGNNYTCGWYLDIEVINNYKGGMERFRIFTNHQETFLGSDLEYFIVAQPNNGFVPKCVENYEVSFKWDNAGHSAFGPLQLIYPIDPKSIEEFEEEWMIDIKLTDGQGPRIGGLSFGFPISGFKQGTNKRLSYQYTLFRLKDFVSGAQSIIHTSNQKRQIPRCPFGICKGVSAQNLYNNGEAAFNNLAEKDNIARAIEPPISGSVFENYITNNGGGFNYLAAYSERQGVCIVRMNLEMPAAKKAAYKYEVIDMMNEEMGFNPEEQKLKNGVGLIWLHGDMSKFDNVIFASVNAIDLDYGSGENKFISTIEYRFENYNDCVAEAPLIASEFE